MSVEKFFFHGLSLLTFIYAFKVQIEFLLNRDKIKETKGRIINLEFVFPEAMMHRNAKLATFEYYVEGKRYISRNSMKMPISSNIGDVMNIKYFIDNPHILYTKTKLHFYLSIFTSIICFLLGMLEY